MPYIDGQYFPDFNQEFSDVSNSTSQMKEEGNIDLTNRPKVKNGNDTSTVRSASFNFGDGETLLPTVSDDGRLLSNDEAIQQFKDTGKHLGKFNTPDEADKYAKFLHESQAQTLPQQSFTDKLLGNNGPRYQTWPEKAVRGAISGAVSAFTLPGDVLSGKVEPGSNQEIERAMDLAGMMVFGPAPVASRMAEGTLGSFAGVTSKGIDRNRLAQAQLLDAKGIHPDTIWEKTGFFRGADDRWRYEILDKDAKIKDTGFNRRITEDQSGELTPFVSVRPTKQVMTEMHEFNDWAAQTGEFKPITLADALDHPELFKAYPKLKDIRLEPLPKQAADRNVIGQMGDGVMYLKDDLHPEYVRSVILHELQHAIQRQEGFARGGNQLEFRSPKLKEAETFFTKTREASETQIQMEKGWGHKDIEDWKKAIRNEEHEPGVKLELFKRKYPDVYERLKTIVEGEKLLKEQSEIEFTKYQRLMGEVEARNVQTRMFYDSLKAKMNTPRSTEDVPRFLQEKR